MDEFTITRRTAFVAGALGAVAAATLGKTAIAAEEKKSDTKTNEEIVNDFIAAWNDPNKAVTFPANNCVVRMEEDKPAITGPFELTAP